MPAHGPADAKTLTIGALVAALSEEFPDLTISKVRFLESKGLLQPERKPSGYRLFSTGDVERLRYVLTAQRDRFWPLEVIKDALDAIDRGLTPGADTASALPAVPESAAIDSMAAMLVPAASSIRLTTRELARTAGIDESGVEGLVGYGLLHPDQSGHFDEDDLVIAKAAGRLAAYGLEPRHLRAFRTAADREIALVEQVRGPATRRSGEDPTTAILSACLSLHAALVRRALTR